MKIVRDLETITIAFIQEVVCWLSICIFIFDIDPYQKSIRRSHTFWQWMSLKWWKLWKLLLLPSNGMSYLCFRLVYSQFTLTLSKGQYQDHAHYDCRLQIFRMWCKIWTTLPLPWNWKSWLMCLLARFMSRSCALRLTVDAIHVYSKNCPYS